MNPSPSRLTALGTPPTVSSFDHDPQVWKDPRGREGPRLRGAAASHVGFHREENEDRFLLRPDAGLFAVADGMGGHEAGEVAATLAVESLADAAQPRVELPAQCLRQAVWEANRRIQGVTESLARRTGMGTTLSAIWIQGGRAVIAHVGDSRVYRLRNGRLEQISEDHTLLAEALRGGFDPERAARLFPSNVLTRAVGIQREVEPLLVDCSVQPGDRFLLCSDGLTDMVAESVIAEQLTVRVSPTQAANGLMVEALAAGGGDNVTVVVIDAVSA